MASPDAKISFLLTGGIDTRQLDEFVAPVVQQGSAPSLVDSRNTRLSVMPGTCVRSPAVSVVGNVGGSCYGLIPSECGRTTVAFNRPGRGYNRVFSGTTGPSSQLKSYVTGQAQNNYTPVQISRAGSVPGAIAAAEPSVTYHNNEVWYAYAARFQDVWTIAVSVTDTEGTSLASPQAIAFFAYSSAVPWVGITAHGANGILLWYLNELGQVKVRTLTRSGNSIGAGSASTVYAPTLGATAFDVVSCGDAYAVLVGEGLVLGNTQIIRVNAATLATTSTAVTTGTPAYVACSCISISGVEYVSIASSDTTDTVVTLYRVSDMAVIWGLKTAPAYGSVSLSWLTTGGVTYVVCAISSVAGGAIRTQFFRTNIDGSGSLSSSSLTDLPWLKLHAHARTWDLGNGEIYPVFFMYRIYNPLAGEDLGYDTTAADLLDPSVTVYVMGDLTHITPIARYGVLRGGLAPARAPSFRLSSKSASASGDRFLTTYLKDGPDKSPIAMGGFQARFVELDFSAKQPAFAHDKDGVSLIAAALPVQWDGQSIVEIGSPLHTPKLIVDTTGGTGPTYAAGVYSFIAVQQWVDGAGLLHRSSPSNIQTLTLAGTEKLLADTTLPDSFRDGNHQPGLDVIIYATEANGTSYHALTCSEESVTGSGLRRYSNVGLPDISRAQIYSLGTAGEELTPQPPPPLRDIAIIGSRAWGIDAEVPTRLVYSKMRISGIGFEWHPALEINFPSGSGELLAIRELEGLPIVFTSNAIFQIAGEGPDNTGGGGYFGSPVRIATRGCDNAKSVVTTPAGIMWQDGEDMLLLSSGGLKVFPNISIPGQIVGAVVLRNEDEVVFTIDSIADRLVYNYVTDKFTVWDNQTFTLNSSMVAQLPWDREVALLYAPANTTVYKIDGATVGSAASMSWETDWIYLCGDFQDHVIVRNIIFNGRTVTPHSLTIQAYVDFENSPSTTLVWSDAEIATLTTSDGRYTIKTELCKQNCRAVKIRISDTAVESDSGMSGVAPRSLTVVYAQQALTYEDAILQGAYKG